MSNLNNWRDSMQQNVPIRERIAQYRESPAINRSLLKAALEGPASIKLAEQTELYYEDEETLLFGSLADAKLTAPDLLSDYYFGECQSKPSDALQSFMVQAADDMLSMYGEVPALNNTKVLSRIQELMNAKEYDMRKAKEELSLDTRIFSLEKEKTKVVNSICKLPNDYWEDLRIVRNTGKKLVSKDQREIVEICVNKMMTSPRTARYCTVSDNVFFQVPIYFTWEGRDYKVLLDRIEYHPEDNSLTPADYKVMGGPTIMFPSRARQFRLDLQALLYTKAVQFFADYYGLKVNPFLFIVNSYTHPYEPRVFQMTQNDMMIALHGANVENGIVTVTVDEFYNFDTSVNNYHMSKSYRIEGFTEALRRYDFYTQYGTDINYNYFFDESDPPEDLNLWL